MRSLSLTLGFLSLLLLGMAPKTAAVPTTMEIPQGTPTWQEVAASTAYPQVRLLLHSVEYARVKGDMGSCDDLAAIPLYEKFPSAEDWSAYCTAVATGDQERCLTIDGTIEPDLQSLCLRYSAGRKPAPKEQDFL